MALTASHTQGEQKKWGKRDASIKQNRQTTKSAIGDVGTGNGNYEANTHIHIHTHSCTLAHTLKMSRGGKKTGPTLRFLRVYIFSNNFYFFFFVSLIIFCFRYFFRTLIAATRARPPRLLLF